MQNKISEKNTILSVTSITTLDKAIHGFVRASIKMLAFMSRPPGVFLLFPAVVLQHGTFVFGKWGLFFVGLYWVMISYYVFVALTLYFVSENPTLRRKVCRYLDAPEVLYPDDFDEAKGRDVAEKGFTFKQLSSVTEHGWRVIMVPIVLVCISFPVHQWAAELLSTII
jgi:hypothetical protein